jgi:MFS family permease
MLATLLLGGALADRYPRRAMMIASDLSRFVLVGLLAGLDVAGALSVPVLSVLSLLVGLGSGFFRPAFGGIVPLLVESHQLASANALIVLAQRLAIGIGPVFAGVLYAAAGSAIVFFFDAASFVVSAIFVLRVRPRPVGQRVVEGTFRSIKAGLAYVCSVPWLWVTIAVFSFYLLLALAPMQVLLPDIVKHHFHRGVGSFGLLMTLQGIGQASGALLCGQLGQGRGRGRRSYELWALSALLVAVIALAPWFWLAAPVAYLRGVCFGFASATWAVLLMELVPERLLSRVVSLDYFGSTGFMPIGFLAAGALGAIASPQALLAGGAVLSTGLLLAGLAHREVRTVQ